MSQGYYRHDQQAQQYGSNPYQQPPQYQQGNPGGEQQQYGSQSQQYPPNYPQNDYTNGAAPSNNYPNGGSADYNNSQDPTQQAPPQDPSLAQSQVEYQQGMFRDNNDTAKTYNTDMRRRYPTDKANKKNEWIGVEKHLSEVNDEIRKNEIEITRLRQKELLSEIEKKLIWQLQQKQNELAFKRRENEEVLRRMAAFQDEQLRSQQDKKIMQQNMADYYQKQRSDQIRKDNEFRVQKNEWENKLLDYNQQRIAEEQRRNKDHKEFLKNSIQSDYHRAQAKKDADRLNEMQNKMEYNDLIQMNAERELTKEENYRNFYRMAAENQQKLHENHFNNVFMPLAKKQRELEDMISKGITEVERRRLQAELDKILKQKAGLIETKEKNQNLLGEKQYQAELEKTLKEQQVKDRLDDLNNYKQYQDFKKQEELDGKRKYKDYLDQQYKERQDILQNEQRMTRNEKGLNRLDLQAYKMHDNGLYTMLPGWAPQIGQLPPRQNREVMQEQIMDKIRKQNVDNDQTQSSQIGGTSLGSPTLQNRTLAKAAQSSLVMQSHPNLGQYQKIGEPEKRYEHPVNFGQNYGQASNAPSTKHNGAILKYGHNPIYNPMPFNNQNPYISKEFTRAVMNKPVYNNPGYPESQGHDRYPEPPK